MKIKEASDLASKILSEVKSIIVGKDDVLEKVMVGVLANGHILIEDFPGLAKTTIARSFSLAMGCKFKRVQFVSDLLPSDIIGTYVYDQKNSSFSLMKGPIFTNVLLADEINRAPPKTQSALLEAMQERQVTIEGETNVLDRPFIVLATQNPIEYEGVYPLPEAQIDRFMMRISVGYPSKDEEIEILDRRKERKKEEFDVNIVANPEKIVEMQKVVENVHVEEDVESYIVDIVQSTRRYSNIEVGASPRGSLAIWQLARANAILRGRDYVIPDDIKAVAISALSHRLILKAGPWLAGAKSEKMIDEILSRTPVPKVMK
ncbi:MAG: MoxR family ATPase [Candidatus Atabeyarchaeum deiterrae]